MATATQLKKNGNRATETQPENDWSHGFSSLRRISKEDVPVRQYHHRSALGDLLVMKELNTSLSACEQGGINPYEIAGEIDMNSPDIQKVSEGRKRFFQSLRGAIKHAIHVHNLSGKVDVVARGNRLFVIGRDASTS